MFLILFLLAQVAAKSVKTWGCEGDAEGKDLPPPPTPSLQLTCMEVNLLKTDIDTLLE